MVKAGELIHFIKIRRRQDVPFEESAVNSEFGESKGRWARIRPVGTAIYADGQQTDHGITHRVLMRYVEGLTTVHEILYGASVYRVLRSAPLNGERVMTLVEVEQIA